MDVTVGRVLFTEEQIREVRKRVESGEKRSDVALAFGVSRQTVYNLVASE